MTELGWFALSRIYLAQIVGVNEDAGTVDVVVLDGGQTKRETLELPWTGFSMNGHRSSWMRYFPQLRAARDENDKAGGDLVYVGFGPKGDAKILSMAVLPGDYAGFTQAKTTNGKNVPRGDWGSLRMGEFDARSTGGAYIYGDRYGSLLLSAGPLVQMRLNKANNEVRADAGLWVLGAAGSEVRIGDVKRKLPLAYKETSADSPSPRDTATKEFRVHLQDTITGRAIADYEFGAVRSAVGMPVLGTAGTVPGFLRERKTIYDSAGVFAVHTSEVDVLGNQRVAFGTSATGLDVDGLTVAADASLLSMSVETQTSARIAATTSAVVHGTTSAALSSDATVGVSGVDASLTGTATALVDAPVVQVGAAAIEPAPHGLAVQRALTALQALAMSMAAVESAPVVGRPGAAVAWTTVATTLAAILAAPPGAGGLLSAKVLVE